MAHKSGFAGDVPKCATVEQFRGWTQANKHLSSPMRDKLAGFCEDCTPRYQSEMVEAGRCENHQVCFTIDKFGFTKGFIPGINTMRKVVATRIIPSARVAIQAKIAAKKAARKASKLKARKALDNRKRARAKRKISKDAAKAARKVAREVAGTEAAKAARTAANRAARTAAKRAGRAADRTAAAATKGERQ